MQSFFSNKSSGCNKTLSIAREANSYARAIIVKGYTGLNNDIALNANYADYVDHLRKGIQGSAFKKMEGIGVNDIIDQKYDWRVQHGKSRIFALYASIISVTAKFSLGNCEILALLLSG